MMRTQYRHDDRRTRRDRGLVLVYSLAFMLTLVAIASLAVDYGHAQLARLEIQRAADLAARAGAYELSRGNGPTSATTAAVTAASAIAMLNPSDSAGLVVRPGDIVIGNYDAAKAPAFSASRGPANAVRVTLRRDGVVNPAVPLVLAPLVGMRAVAVEATAQAHVTLATGTFGLVGIESISFGSVGAVARVIGDLASNGPIAVGSPLGIGISVTGNVQSYGSSVGRGSAALVAGDTGPLSSSLCYPSADLPTSNDNARIARYLNGYNDFSYVDGTTVPAGTYVIRDLNMIAGISVNVAGPVTFYVSGTARILAGVNLLGATNADPQNFIVKVVSGGKVAFLANLLTPVVMTVYAPDSDILIAVGVNQFKGTLIGKTLTVAAPILSTFTEVKPVAQPANVKVDI